jgi:hypothetical protein
MASSCRIEASKWSGSAVAAEAATEAIKGGTEGTIDSPVGKFGLATSSSSGCTFATRSASHTAEAIADLAFEHMIGSVPFLADEKTGTPVKRRHIL